LTNDRYNPGGGETICGPKWPYAASVEAGGLFFGLSDVLATADDRTATLTGAFDFQCGVSYECATVTTAVIRIVLIK